MRCLEHLYGVRIILDVEKEPKIVDGEEFLLSYEANHDPEESEKRFECPHIRKIEWTKEIPYLLHLILERFSQSESLSLPSKGSKLVSSGAKKR